ncbi:sulfate transporter family-domain-containing protein [Podospora conica]|nr:sulfate transporter family-domain-containing protein [Schizothecium conicum]
MSSPSNAFSSWRARSSSFISQNSQDDPPLLSGSPVQAHHTTNTSEARNISSSVGSPSHREPIRSYVHGSVREKLAPVDSLQAAQSVREDTAELASYFLSDKKDERRPSFLDRTRPHLTDDPDPAEASPSRSTETIEELSEPSSPETVIEDPLEGPSMLTTMLRRSPPEQRHMPVLKADQILEDQIMSESEDETGFSSRNSVLREEDQDTIREATETAPLLSVTSNQSWRGYGAGNGNGNGNGASRDHDLEGQKSGPPPPWPTQVANKLRRSKAQATHFCRVLGDPKCWDRRAIWRTLVVTPTASLPAVIVGLLLNILDALSYGMILFPLGHPIFAGLGSAGISIFYVSTIISQLTFSAGSIFKGGVGSELIEVVPFFHSMAMTITGIVGDDSPDAVIATTITSYALSSMLTGTVFYLMGKFKFGYIVGFIPRHILIGCIGGVGWFLVATGFEVTARMNGSLEYDFDTLKRLMQPDTVPLWVIPFVLAVILFYGQTRVASKFFLPGYIVAIPILFYIVVFSVNSLNPDMLRDQGWIFEGPPAGEPWWYFYTLYKFNLVHWGAIVQCIPAMFALTFFGILHVPINVPALALNTGEDHADLNHELKLHGYSNILSGLAGSIQNYLVYANTLFFMRSGGDTRFAGVQLAMLTGLVMMIGPSLIGFIPVMMVGVLIFDLGFELLLEAVWHPRKKLKRLEYLTVIAIVLIMGMHDFVVGIGVGILLAFVSLIFQTSRVSAVRGSYCGEVVGSTVRRNPTQQHYLRQVGRQINIIKLAGYLFFGTIVSVEDRIRVLISDEQFRRQPIRYLIIDMRQVTGIDYSAGEVFNTINRLLKGRNIDFVLSGIDSEGELGRSLRAVGLGVEVRLLPELNSALEFCENELLKILYANQTAAYGPRVPAASSNLDVPGNGAPNGSMRSLDLMGSSPRRSHLHEAARKSLGQVQVKREARWRSFKEPLRLILQIFQDVSDRNEDFWFRAVPYFGCREYPAGTVLFRRGERADAFYLVEAGILRAEYELPQGGLFESIVAGTTCGELPFFSETNRSATCVVERACVVWEMQRKDWERLQREEAEVAQELLRISLKLTSERLSVITAYTLTMAG